MAKNTLGKFLTHLTNTISNSPNKKIIVVGNAGDVLEEELFNKREQKILIGIGKTQLRYSECFDFNICNSRDSITRIYEEFGNQANIVSHIKITEVKYFLDAPLAEDFDFVENILEHRVKPYRSGLFTVISLLNHALPVSDTANDLSFVGFSFATDSIYDSQFFKSQSKNLTILFDNEYKLGKRALKDAFNSAKEQTYTIEQLIKINREMYHSLVQKVNSDENAVLIVAEFTNNHLGELSNILKMIELAKLSGADLVKLQKREVETFYTEEKKQSYYPSPYGGTLQEYREGVEIRKHWMAPILAQCAKYKIPVFFSVLDWDSYLWLREFKIPLIKLPSTISNHKEYIYRVLDNTEEDLVISTGFTSVEYERWVINTLLEVGKNIKNLFLLQCISAYPAPIDECNISVVRKYAQYGKEIEGESSTHLHAGYSSHDAGFLGSMLAVSAGARMVEKHVKLEEVDWIHFDNVALSLINNEFKTFVENIRKAQLISGYSTKKITDNEHHKY